MNDHSMKHGEPPKLHGQASGVDYETIHAILDQLPVVDTTELPRDYVVAPRQHSGVFIRSGRGSRLLNLVSRLVGVLMLAMLALAGWGVWRGVRWVKERGMHTDIAHVAPVEADQAPVNVTAPARGASCSVGRVERRPISGHLSQYLLAGSAGSDWGREHHGKEVWRTKELAEGRIIQRSVGKAVTGVAILLRGSVPLCVALDATGVALGGDVEVGSEGQVLGKVAGHVWVTSPDGGAHVTAVQVAP